MDPLSVTASIGSLCVIAVKLINTLSDFVDNSRSASTEVQALTNELASLYSCLGHVKLAIQQPRHADGVSDSWSKDLDNLLKDCVSTLNLLQETVNKAKVVETHNSGQQLWRTVKFTFKAKTIDLLRRRIVLQNGVLTNLLSLLLDAQSGRIQEKLDDVHKLVTDLVSSQRNVKEVLVVLENDDGRRDQADYVLQDRTSRNSARTQSSGVPQSLENNSSTAYPPWMDSTTGQAARLSSSQSSQTGSGQAAGSSFVSSHSDYHGYLGAMMRQSEHIIAEIRTKKWQIEKAKVNRIPRERTFRMEQREAPNPSSGGLQDLFHAFFSIPLNESFDIPSTDTPFQDEIFVRLIVDRVIYITIESSNGETLLAGRTPIKFFTAVAATSLLGRVVSLETSSWWKKNVPQKVVEIFDSFLLEPQFYDLEVTLKTEEQAKSLFEALQVGSSIVEESWKVHATAISPLVSDLHLDGACNLQESALLEMCRSWCQMKM